MAQTGVVLDKDQFNCSVCLDVLKDPVTIPCGHSYCSGCIKGYWDQDDYLAIYGCPQCRQTFNPRPQLHRNTMLADVVEKFKNTGLHEVVSPPTQCLAGPGDVECDACTGRKNKAVKSCLVCLASYCDTHLQPHYESAAFKKHKLVSASKTLQETICSRHDKLLEVYCRTDKTCICYLCLTDEHKGHDTVLAEAEIQEKQNQVSELQRNCQRRLREREEDAQQLKQAILSLTRSARTAVEESDKVFNELIRSIDLKRFEVRELISAQEKTAVSQAEMLLQKMDMESSELRKTMASLDRLSRTEDHIHFLQSCQSLSALPEPNALPTISSDTSFTFAPVMTAVSDFRSLLDEVCQGGFGSIYDKVRDVAIVDSSKASVQSLSMPENSEAHVHMEAANGPIIVGLDQGPVNLLNPFLPSGSAQPAYGGFSNSPFGFKLSTSSTRLRQAHRRSHPRRK